MKKCLTLLCMIACIFGLTACGSGGQLTDYEQYKVNYAKQMASESIVPMLSQFQKDAAFDEFTPEEVAYRIGSEYSLNVDGYGFSRAVESFQSAKQEMGAVTGVKSATASIDGNQIIVKVNVSGEKRDATAEVIFSNNMFMTLESAALNPNATIAELMVTAALNTVIGMGTVFAVLILISWIISGLQLISKAQGGAAKKAVAEVPSGVDNAVAHIVGQEEIEDETDDCELVAVIAAAIAASEGAVTTDGFVVRSIRRKR